jgi:hypothetical protein
VATIALGVGASTALFAVVDAVVLKPLPLPDPERLVRVYDTNPAAGVVRAGVASGNLADWRRRTRALCGLAGLYTMGRTLTLGTDSEVVLTAQVTADFFPSWAWRPRWAGPSRPRRRRPGCSTPPRRRWGPIP